MKKVMLVILCLSAMAAHKAQAQERTMPTDTISRDNMRTPMDNMKMPMDNMRIPMDNMRMKMDTTPPNMPMKMDATPPSMPTKTMPDKAYDRKIDRTVNRMDRDRMIDGTMPPNNELKGMYNGQRIRSDTIRNGVSSYKSDYKMTPKNKKAMDGTQNGKYNSEMSRDSMPDGRYGDRMRPRQMPNGKMEGKMNRDSMPKGKHHDKMHPMSDDKKMDKMSRDSMRKARNDGKMGGDKMPSEADKDKQRMAAENRSVMMHDGKVMIVRNGKMTVVKSFTNLNRGVKVMSDGTIVRQDGTKTMLKEGESVNMMGEIMPTKQ